MLNFKYEKTLKKLRDILLTENQENFKMIQLYVAYLEGNADEEDLKKANDQFGEILKNLGLGFLVILPFSPVTIPFLFKKAQELIIDLVPNWYKALSKSDDRLE